MPLRPYAIPTHPRGEGVGESDKALLKSNFPAWAETPQQIPATRLSEGRETVSSCLDGVA